MHAMKRTALLLLSPIILSCTQSDPVNLTGKEKKIISGEVEIMLNTYFQDIRKEGLTGEFRHLDPSPDFFWVPPGYDAAITYDSVKTVLTENAGNFLTIEFEWETLRIVPLKKDIANYTGVVNGTMIGVSGDTSSVKMIETGTVIRRDDGWKILSGQSRHLSGDQ